MLSNLTFKAKRLYQIQTNKIIELLTAKTNSKQVCITLKENPAIKYLGITIGENLA